MTADGTTLPSDNSKQRLEILLVDYQSCREDERVQLAAVAAVIGVLVTVIGLMAAAVTQTCEFSSSKSCVKAPDYLLAASPLIPIALLGYAIYFLVVGTLRTYYMRGLENEIRSFISTPLASLGDVMPASYMGIVQEVVSLRRGRALYRLITNLILVVIVLVFGGYTAYVGFHVQTIYQVLMSIAYSVVAILFVWQVAQGSVGGRTFFERAAQDFLNNRPGTTLPTVRTEKGSSPAPKDGSLLAYLIFPRPEDWIKWLIAPAVFFTVAWSFGDLGRWRTFVQLWLILEYLIYEARYQWNDARGIDEDPLHSESRARHRLPVGPVDRTRRNVLVSLAVAIGRLTLALIIGEALGLFRPVLFLMILVLSIAIVYERLRSLHSPLTMTRPTPAVVAIWCIVGLGYGVRSGLGLVTGGLSLTDSLTWIGMVCFIFLGIMFVLLTWVLEAASCCYRQESDGTWWVKTEAVLKPHIMVLLHHVPINVNTNGQGKYSDGEDGGMRRILRERGKTLAPWNFALVVSAGLGGALGIGLAHAMPSFSPESMAVSISLIAAGVLAYCNSQKTRLIVSGVTAFTLIASIISFGHWPFTVLAAGPWMAIASLYLVFRGSSYRDLKEFGPNLLRAISSLGFILKLGPCVLHAVIGEKAWGVAGFGNNTTAVSVTKAATSSHQIEYTTPTPHNMGSPNSGIGSSGPRRKGHSGPCDK